MQVIQFRLKPYELLKLGFVYHGWVYVAGGSRMSNSQMLILDTGAWLYFLLGGEP